MWHLQSGKLITHKREMTDRQSAAEVSVIEAAAGEVKAKLSRGPPSWKREPHRPDRSGSPASVRSTYRGGFDWLQCNLAGLRRGPRVQRARAPTALLCAGCGALGARDSRHVQSSFHPKPLKAKGVPSLLCEEVSAGCFGLAESDIDDADDSSPGGAAISETLRRRADPSEVGYLQVT
ncbi:hypothetical protein BDP55DRAFT_630047 [Colletotrichum godetiae]|uniref:Uncharacterized protein n=1 Tax=Colletotrichum godetiae TaxID=1209918 RepID=A0AAJ0APC0_9PEZI|nr:uncharacterized protein BDP55DRAFT_630047 [Colletotrichum godetiae]KAK1687915.1 hypothetical protein BDP55DRAFT_630047 [Colletotrichum godetiae]